MIDYQTFCAIQDHHALQGLNPTQIAEALQLDPRTVAKWLAEPRLSSTSVESAPKQARPAQSNHPALAAGASLQRPAGVSAPMR